MAPLLEYAAAVLAAELHDEFSPAIATAVLPKYAHPQGFAFWRDETGAPQWRFRKTRMRGSRSATAIANKSD